MTRKHIDASGNVVERDDAPVVAAEESAEPSVVGSIPAPDPALVRAHETTWLERFTAAHILLARFIRGRILLMPDVDLNTLHENQKMIAKQHLGFANLVADIRLRMRHYERTIPMIGQARRQFDLDQATRQKEIARRLSALTSHPTDDSQTFPPPTG